DSQDNRYYLLINVNSGGLIQRPLTRNKLHLSPPSRFPAVARSRIGRRMVREQLEEAILAGRHLPGEKLLQQKLAGQHNVAQAVVREALVELQARGLVESIDNRGVFVAELTVETLIESLQIRERLEGLAVALCCRRTTRAQLEELAGIA